MDDTTTSYRICPLCEACCGLEVRHAGGRVVAIRGAAADVFSAGYVCPKGYALKDLHEDPDRLRRPLVRRGGQFVETGWDEAFDEIESRLTPILRSHGGNAVGVTFGNPSAHKMGIILYLGQLVKALGTRSVFTASTLDQMPKQLSCGLMFGHWLTIPVPDIERTELLLVIGANPMASNGSLWTVPDFRAKAKALRARGGRLVVIDPRRTETAEVADAHHFIRPGSDALLLAAIAHTLFDEARVRTGRLTPHLSGLETLPAALAPFTPERVAARCGIDASVIRGLARALAETPRAAVYGRLGTCTQAHGTLASWLVDVVNVLTGHLDEPGGAMFPKAAAFAHNTQGAPGRGRGVATGRWHGRASGAPEVSGELPMNTLAAEIEAEGGLSALITVAGNPVLSSPNGGRIAAALGRLDFMVACDIYLNETTRHAHVILPAPSPLQDSHYDVALPQLSFRNHARYSAPVFERAADQPAEWQTLLRLAAVARGLGAHADVAALDDALLMEDLKKHAGDDAEAMFATLAPRRGPDRLLDLALRRGPYGLTLDAVQAAPGGIDLGPLQPRVPEVLRTPSGRIELAPPALLADLPRLAAELETAPPPLVVIGRRDVRSNNSWMHNLPTLAKGPERCTALVHPDDALRAGVADGARARLRGSGGRAVEVTVALTTATMPGVISLPHGWGHGQPGTRMRLAAERPGANLNELLDDEVRDPLSGNAVLSGGAVTLETP